MAFFQIHVFFNKYWQPIKINNYLLSVLLILIICCGCSVKYPVVGYFDNYNEVFKGIVEHNLLSGGGVIEAQGEITKLKCRGDAIVTGIPGIGCKGQSGVAKLYCDDGREIHAKWVALSCTTGFGTGYDQNGSKFSFTFGMNEEEANQYIKKEMVIASNKPDLPPAYKPKETRKEKGYSTGTGFFVSDDGYLITNYHVVQDAKEILIITNSKKELKGNYIIGSLIDDIALIKVNAVTKSLPILKKHNIAKGEEVFTLGYPLVQIQGQEQKASFGRINSLSGIKGDIRFFQIDIPVQPGNSGGPIINTKGQIAGVVTATLDQLVTLRISGHIPQNVNYAVKSDYLLPLIRHTLGKDWSPLTPQESKKDISELIKMTEQSVVLIIAK
jgi:S1-C subfamily serine protease